MVHITKSVPPVVTELGPWENQSEGVLLARSLMPAVVRKLGELLAQDGVSNDVKVKAATTLTRIAETDRSRIV